MLQWNNCNLEVKQMNFGKCLLGKQKTFSTFATQPYFILIPHDNGETGHTLHVREGSRKEQGTCTIPTNLYIL